MKCKEGKETSVQAQSSPNLKGEAHSQLTSQTSKGSLIQWFCENVCNLLLRPHMDQVYVPFLEVITQKVISNLNVLGL